MSEYILGISAYYHDSAATLLMDGEIIAAAHEERFTRKKHDPSFPTNAILYVLKEAGIDLNDLTVISFYDKPLLKFERLLETYHSFAPKGLISFLSSMPVWVKEKLFMRKVLNDELKKIGKRRPVKLLFPEHHLSHAASAFFPSPFKKAAILTIDGVGEWATTTICHGNENRIKILRQLDFPHSLGLLYSAFTYYCGFKVNDGEYKLMGLAPYGDRASTNITKFIHIIENDLVDIREDGSFLLNMEYFRYPTGLSMCFNKKWEKLFGIPNREMETELTQPYMDLASAIQLVTEKIIFRLAETAKKVTGEDHLVMAGGVALNCVANGKLLKKNLFANIWIQPAAGDAGGALGAAYVAHHIWKKHKRKINANKDAMKGAYLGPKFHSVDIRRIAQRYNAPYKYYPSDQSLCQDIAELLKQGFVIGWFQGRMEFGPRALGNRSILGDPRHPEMQKKLNLKIKYRESFRPFAPSVLEEEMENYFDLKRSSPYMLFTAEVLESRKISNPVRNHKLGLHEKLYQLRSDIPAVTHIDYSARIQSVSKEMNEKFWELIEAFKNKTDCSLVVNTSFNVRGEPIVCSPEDAYKCFMKTEMDYLVMENFLFVKVDQPIWNKSNEKR